MPKVKDSPGRRQRRAAGKEIRKKVPRTSFAKWDPPPDRRDPVDILVGQGADRVQSLLPIRYARMLSSPFAFYRGAAAVMASDLSYSPRTPLTVQLAGDAHLMNFGGYASPDRTFVFDVNDFDETLPGPFEWDLKRLSASFAIAGRDRKFAADDRAALVRRVVKSYRDAMNSFSQMSRMDVYYTRLTADDIVDRFGKEVDAKAQRRFLKLVQKAQGRTSEKALAKLTTFKDGQYHLVSNPPYLVPLEELDEASGTDRQLMMESVSRVLTTYVRSLSPDRKFLMSGYRVVGVARKVVGVGSVGTRCWVALMVADQDENDVLVLQVKEAVASVLEEYLGKSREGDHGKRVVDGQRMMQAATDVMLGWAHNDKTPDGTERDFYLRQLWDWKESADLDVMDVPAMDVYARLCGWTLARAHARSGDRVAIAGYLGTSGTLDDAMAVYAEAYADQNEKDHAALQAAADSGRIQVAASGW